MQTTLSGPSDFQPDESVKDLLTDAGLECNFEFVDDPMKAVKDADVVYTDVWVSMGKETEKTDRIPKMKPYSVTPAIMNAANKDALFMHSLTAHPQEVLDGERSIVYDQAENRLHTQKSILARLAESK